MADLEESMVDPVLEAVSSHIQAIYIIYHSLLAMVDMAIRRGLLGIPGEDWAKAVVTKLNNVGVESLQDFIASVTAINRMLAAVGHR
jgi:hypothetical protein